MCWPLGYSEPFVLARGKPRPPTPVTASCSSAVALIDLNEATWLVAICRIIYSFRQSYFKIQACIALTLNLYSSSIKLLNRGKSRALTGRVVDPSEIATYRPSATSRKVMSLALRPKSKLCKYLCFAKRLMWLNVTFQLQCRDGKVFLASFDGTIIQDKLRLYKDLSLVSIGLTDRRGQPTTSTFPLSDSRLLPIFMLSETILRLTLKPNEVVVSSC